MKKQQKRKYNDFLADVGKKQKRVFCTSCQQWVPTSNSIHSCYDFHSGQVKYAEAVKPMTKGELCQLLEDEAKLYLKVIDMSIKRNGHMYSFKGKVNKKLAVAVLVDYINYIAGGQGLDLGLLEEHLIGKKK
ncbi:hypothetical protein ACFLQL_00645 [Verrucomicrobiota bacterium]